MDIPTHTHRATHQITHRTKDNITTHRSTHRTTTTHHTLREGTPHTNHTLHTLDRGEVTVVTMGKGEVTQVDWETVSPGTETMEVEMEGEEREEKVVM